MKSMSLASSATMSLALLRPYHQNLTTRNFSMTPPKLRLQCVLVTKPTFSNFRLMAMAPGVDPVKTGVPESVPVRVANELLLAGHRYLDVRTPEEFSSGHPPGAVNIPYMFKAGNGMIKNPKFLEEVSKHFGKDAEIIVGCQIGKRSLMAATDLFVVGYNGVTDIAGGYIAWTQSGLPTE